MGSRRGFKSRGEKEEQANPYMVWGAVGIGGVAVLLVGFFLYRSFFSGGFVGRELTSAEDNIKKIAFIYREYTSANRGKPPANVDELKAWAKKLSKEKQADLSIEDVVRRALGRLGRQAAVAR